MSDRSLSRKRKEVFGHKQPGTTCRICGRDVDDGRAKVCSDYCRNIQGAVMGLLQWTSVRRRIIDRDDETCQECGYDHGRERRAREHIRDRIEDRCGDRPTNAARMSDPDSIDEVDWDDYHDRVDAYDECRERMIARYGDPYETARTLEVDHIQRLADGGHPFDPANLQTLCDECHEAKTSAENSGSRQTPSRADLNESLFQYVSDGGG